MRKRKYIIIVLIILLLIGFFTVFLPQIMTSLSNCHFFSTKVNNNITRLSRIEFIKICVSILGPVLTMMVFLNTLDMQMKTEEKQNKLEEKQDKSEKRRAEKEEELYQKDLLLQIDHEFYSLLNMFIEIQKDQNVKTAVNVLQKLAIFQENGFGFNNDYAFSPKDLTGSRIQSTIEKSGPLKGVVKYVTFKSFDISELMGGYSINPKDVVTNSHDTKVSILNEQYEEMQIYLGRYFKMFHRIVKTLNEYYDDNNDFDTKKYAKYIGTLRTQISPAEFQVILFNSIYIKRGIGLGIQLLGSGFFGDDFDFETDQHFETSVNEKWFLSLSTINNKNEENINSEKRKELSKYISVYIKESDYEKYKRIDNFENLYNLFSETKSYK